MHKLGKKLESNFPYLNSSLVFPTTYLYEIPPAHYIISLIEISCFLLSNSFSISFPVAQATNLEAILKYSSNPNPKQSMQSNLIHQLVLPILFKIHLKSIHFSFFPLSLFYEPTLSHTAIISSAMYCNRIVTNLFTLTFTSYVSYSNQ
jgi:hypothetical protein